MRKCLFVFLLLLGLAAPAQAASLFGQLPSQNVIVTRGNLEWVWASPCAGVEPSCDNEGNRPGNGIVPDGDLADHLPMHGFNIPTNTQWTASFANLSELHSAFAPDGNFAPVVCGASYFSQDWDSCNPNDLSNGFVWNSPLAPDVFHRNNSLSETFVVREAPAGPVSAVPLPPSVILFGAGILSLVGLGARRKLRKYVFCALLFLCLATPVYAAPVTIEFTGITQQAPLGLLGMHHPLWVGGDQVSGSFTYESATPANALSQSQGLGLYPNAVTQFNLTITNPELTYTAALSPTPVNLFGPSLAQFLPYNGIGVSGNESFGFYHLRVPVSGAVLQTQIDDLQAGTVPISLSPIMFDITVNHLLPVYGVSPSPLSPPSMASLFPQTQPEFQLAFTDNANGVPSQLVGGRILAFNDLMNPQSGTAGNPGSITAVPLPPSVILFGAGILALAGLGARSRYGRYAKV